MKAFNVEAKNAMSIVDKMNQIGNTQPVSSAGIGEALKRSASALSYANNTLDESIALIAAANATVQDTSVVGTSLKTISMRLRAMKVELEESGESTEGMAETVSELQAKLLALAGVDIMDGDSLKSTYQIMVELAKVWDGLSDSDSAAILELIAGKRMANTAASIIQNIDIAEKSLIDSQNAAGSAMAENEKYLESIQGHWDKFNATYESLSQNMIDSDTVKTAIDRLTALLGKIDDLAEEFGELPIIIGIATTAISLFSKKGANALRFVQLAGPDSNAFLTGGDFWKDLFKAPTVDTSNFDNIQHAFTRLTALANVSSLGELADDAKAMLSEFDPAVLKHFNDSLAKCNGNIENLKFDIEQFRPSMDGVAKSSKLAAVGTELFNFALNQGIILAVTWALQKLGQILYDYAHRVEIAKEKSSDLFSEYESQKSEIEGLKNQLSDVVEKMNEIEALGPISLSEEEEYNRLVKENAELERQIDLKEALAKLANKEAIEAEEDAYELDTPLISYQKTTSEKREDPTAGLEVYEQYDNRADALKGQINRAEKLAADREKLQEDLRKNFKEYSEVERTDIKNQIEDIDNILAGLEKEMSDSAKSLQSTYDILGNDHEYGKSANEALTSLLEYQNPGYIARKIIETADTDEYRSSVENILKKADGLSSIKEKLSDDDMSRYVEDLGEYGITLDQIASTLAGFESNEISVLRDSNIKEEKESLTELQSELTKVTEAFDKLIAAADEYAESGTISLETFEGLLNLGPEYISMLFDENGQLSLNRDRIKEVTAAYVDQIAHKQAVALIDMVSSMESEEEQLKALSGAAVEASGNLKQFAQNYLLTKYVAANNPISKQVYDETKAMVDGIFNMADATKAGIAKTYGGTADEFAKARAALEHELDMGRISQAEFWDELEKLRDRYFVKGSAEWTEYYREIEKGRSELQEKLLKLEGEAAIKAIDKKIDAKKKELEQLEEEYEAEDKLFELQKARDRYEAAKRNLNTRLYTEDKGWVWVADPTELQNSREELEKLEKEQAREEAKKAIEDEIEALEDLKDKYQEAMDQIGMDLQEHADMLEWLAKFEEMTYDELAAYLEEYADKVVAEYDRIAAAKRKAAEAGEGGGSKKNPNTGSGADVTTPLAQQVKDNGGKTEVIYVHGQRVEVPKSQADQYNKNTNRGFASGTRHAPKSGIATVDEVGPELIARHNETGRLTHLELGDTVFPADMTQRLWDLAATGAFALASASRIPVRTNLHEGAFAAKQPVSNSNDIVLTGCTFELNNVTDVDTFFGELNRIANRHRRK